MLLPSPLPNETLHSRMCRFLAVSGMKAKDFLSYVFGDKRYSVHPFLNANLVDLAKYTKETPMEIWSNQTLLPLYAHYLPLHKEKFKDLSVSSEQLVRCSQSSVFKTRERPLLKFCTDCVIEDVTLHGVSYWHLEHQVLGIEACSHHSKMLEKQYLPDRIRIGANLLPIPSSESQISTTEAVEFSNFVNQKLIQLRNGSLHNCDHTKQLNIKGFLTKQGWVRRKKLFKLLNIYAIKVLEASPNMQPVDTDDFDYWSKVIQGDVSQPPFKHMLLEFFLSRLPNAEIISSTKNRVGVDDKEIREKCLNLLENNYSVPDVHRLTGKSTCFIQLLAALEGVELSYKPILLNESVRQTIINMAWKGFHRKVMAKRFKVSLGSVEQIISSVAGLVAWRKQCKYESKRRRHKLTLLRYKISHPTALRKDIKQNCNAAFFWFYLNEKEWLASFLPPAKKAFENAKPRVDWIERDKELIKQVDKILTESEKPLVRTEIDRLLGGHGWLTSYKHKLPLTMSLLRDNDIN